MIYNWQSDWQSNNDHQMIGGSITINRSIGSQTTSKVANISCWEGCHWFCEVWLKVLKLFVNFQGIGSMTLTSWPLCLKKGACFLACLKSLKVDCSLVQGTGLWRSKLLTIWRSCRRVVCLPTRCGTVEVDCSLAQGMSLLMNKLFSF